MTGKQDGSIDQSPPGDETKGGVHRGVDMVQFSNTQFAGYRCLKILSDHLALWVTKDVGPRVIGLALSDSENLLAVLSEAKSEFPGQETYYFRGGHRLWYGPEKPETTYIPDNQPVDITKEEQGVVMTQVPDQPTGVQKSLRLRVSQGNARVEVDHILSNQGDHDIGLAPWAITQIKPGGVGIFPQNQGKEDEHGFWPNRHVVLWPYTEVQSPYILWKDIMIFVDAQMTSGALKIGFPNPEGWLAYEIEGTLFVKKAKYKVGATYIDRGASSQVYCCSDFIELETLGPFTQLSPGDTIRHTETWELYSQGNWPEEIATYYNTHY